MGVTEMPHTELVGSWIFALITALIVLGALFATVYSQGFISGHAVGKHFGYIAGVESCLSVQAKTFHAPCGCRMEWCTEHANGVGPGAWIENYCPSPVHDGEVQG